MCKTVYIIKEKITTTVIKLFITSLKSKSFGIKETFIKSQHFIQLDRVTVFSQAPK